MFPLKEIQITLNITGVSVSSMGAECKIFYWFDKTPKQKQTILRGEFFLGNNRQKLKIGLLI